MLFRSHGVSWERMCFPFQDFVDTCETLRKSCAGSPQETVVKRAQNSLYGKFGARKEHRKVFKTKDPTAVLGAFPWSDDGQYWFRVEEDEDALAKPEWAAWITAQGRLALLRQAYQLGIEHVLYGDTDSLTVVGVEVPESSEYGGWKVAEKWAEFQAIAPKVRSEEHTSELQSH